MVKAHSQSFRGVFCNRTLNMRAIRAVGYDMDYTLVDYYAAEWERRAYHHLKKHFLNLGWPVEHLEFDPNFICRGLIIDAEHGNIVKANRFGFIKKALHGTQTLDFEAQRVTYARTIVDLSKSRWAFLNTMFSLSEGCMYAQLVDLLDQKKLPETLGYADLYKRVRKAIDRAHMIGQLKADIIGNPDQFVVLDPETPLALLDQKRAGKKILLITNSELSYVVPMMEYTFDRFLPNGMTWKDLFDVIITGAKKPDFFTTESPLYEINEKDERTLRAPEELIAGRFYFGGSAPELERRLGLNGDQILYVGDHMFGDVRVTKSVLRWRTALIIRELEEEIKAFDRFRATEQELEKLMNEKSAMEADYCATRLALQRRQGNYGPTPEETEDQLQKELSDFRARLDDMDKRIGPLARSSTELIHPLWGPLMRTGNDKSHLAYQMERYADIYTSRVSNLLVATPFVYFRSSRGTLPHDPC